MVHFDLISIAPLVFCLLCNQGPTGSGKTEIARRLSTLAEAPFIKVVSKLQNDGTTCNRICCLISSILGPCMRV